MPITQKNIADELGIPLITVARTLGGKGYISPAKRRLIVEKAREMGYVPSMAAKILQSGRTNMVSIVYVRAPAGTTQQHYAAFMETLAEGIGAYGYDLKVKTYGSYHEIRNALPSLVQSNTCDAFVLWGADVEVEPLGALLESLRFPFVARGRHETSHPDWIQTDFDHEGMMRAAVAKIAELGHKRVAYAGHSLGDPSTRHLFAGFLSAVNDYGLLTDEAWHLFSSETKESSEAILEKLKLWGKAPGQSTPTAIACGSGTSSWQEIQKVLLGQGHTFGDGPDQIAAVGVLPWDLMIVGTAWQFQNIYGADDVHAMVEKQLMPLLSGRPPQTILRYTPKLERIGGTFKSKEDVARTLQYLI